MPRYRTEIVIPADRYVCLQLPDDLPVGRALVSVEFLGSDVELPSGIPVPHEDPDREVDDMEWWDEFD